jgi:hypothetical protein
MDLATHQRSLLGLLRSNLDSSACTDHYIQRVAQSPDLQEAKRNIFLWRIYVLERTAPLTFRLLEQRGELAARVAHFIATRNISPFRETQGPAFLQASSESADSLERSVARFELALLKVKAGDQGRHIATWEFEPQGILHSLASATPLPDPLPAGPYHTVVSREFAGNLRIVGGYPTAH